MKAAQKSLSEIQVLYSDLSGEPEILTSIQNFISQMEVSLKEPCLDNPEVDTDESEIVKFQETLKNFLDENKSISKVEFQKFATGVERINCRCPRKPCPSQETISLFLKSFES
ncbi:MAG: hypothetical protein RMY16_22975 [Nostoc sp. DedQUE12b]|uniref:hypothetical protein n=1 Tax=Nostoc sp. DedQUE12b TaxID=3075398 RepID=UPI002AD586F5|nr:hypothetical protein [Nostoc sp. DedQUE12b]MDZ8088400.1 hypothetical protein [Nostoc sp. DedQUE12b]